MKHTGLGLSSFVIAILSVIAMFAVISAAGYIEITTPGGMDETSATAMMIGMLIFAVMFSSVISLGLGIAGLIQKESKKVFPALGLSISAFTMVVPIILIIIGSSME